MNNKVSERKRGEGEGEKEERKGEFPTRWWTTGRKQVPQEKWGPQARASSDPAVAALLLHSSNN